ncbi:MAG TPA: hypothetical protein VGI10_20925 [Polyangiaceae bacterium]|jgi:hypothetical protein
MKPRHTNLAAHRALLGLTLLLAGCRDLSHFDSKPGSAYCGAIIGTPDFQDGLIAAGQPPSLTLKLTLDTGKLNSEPGVLSSNDKATGLCSSTGDPLFQDAPLRAIPQIDHDVLSTMSFGEGHDHDFFTWVDSRCQGPFLALVSLMRNDQVEVRLFKPGPIDATGANRSGFGVFPLSSQPHGCGF